MSFLACVIFYCSLMLQARVLSKPFYPEYRMDSESSEEFGDPSVNQCSVRDSENDLIGRTGLVDKTKLWTKKYDPLYGWPINSPAQTNAEKSAEIIREMLPCLPIRRAYRDGDLWNAITIAKSHRCYSVIGDRKQYGYQQIELTVDCANDLDTVLHHFLHTLGLVHEHNSQDRDIYINMRLDKAKDPTLLEKVFVPEYYSFSVPYNPHSFMHMHNEGRDESIDGEPLYTLTYEGMYNYVKYNDPYKFTFNTGLRHDIQTTDVLKLRSLYNCTNINMYNRK